MTQQAKVPLLAGANTEEQGPRGVLGGGDPTPETLAAAIQKFPERPGTSGVARLDPGHQLPEHANRREAGGGAGAEP